MNDRRDELALSIDWECVAMQRVRSAARALSKSSLAIYVSGEVGSGRRTFATQIANARTTKLDTVATLQPSDASLPLNSLVELEVALVERASELTATEQRTLAEACTRGLRFVAWGTEAEWRAFTPQLQNATRAGYLRIPPLRDRGDEIVAWTRYYAKKHSVGKVLSLTADQEKFAEAQIWTGNLPQLERYVVDALAYAVPDDTTTSSASGRSKPDLGHKVEFVSLSTAVAAFRRDYVLRAIEHFKGNRTRAARALGVDPRTIFRLLSEDTGSDDDDSA